MDNTMKHIIRPVLFGKPLGSRSTNMYILEGILGWIQGHSLPVAAQFNGAVDRMTCLSFGLGEYQ
jgi:hypothetical protein